MHPKRAIVSKVLERFWLPELGESSTYRDDPPSHHRIPLSMFFDSVIVPCFETWTRKINTKLLLIIFDALLLAHKTHLYGILYFG